MTINNILAVKETSKEMGGFQAQASINMLKKMMGPDGLPNKLLDLIKSSANSVDSLQSQAQTQIQNGYLDIKI